MNGIRTIVGIDEVGRGPLAGPVTVCAFSVPHYFDLSLLSGIKDSKKLSAQKREEWYQKLYVFKENKQVSFAVSSVSAIEIDTMGISHCLKKAIRMAIDDLAVDPNITEVRLDGSLYAPKEFRFQTTIIKGDEKEPVISAASIIAKVTRDRMMVDYGLQFPEYGFENHKGYGTDSHRKAIKLSGLTPIHRKTFLTRIM